MTGSSNTPSAGAPTVSIIIATYNRSQPLRHAIQSVLAQTFADWEVIVVGDACTDDTAVCVAAFEDSRIRFVNLPERFGYQSGPNNHGLSLARGNLVAFLNHDDLYFSDHLEVCVAQLERSGADLVWVPTAMCVPNSGATPPHQGAHQGSVRAFSFMLSGVPATPEYWPSAFYFASSWVFRRSLADRVGPWLAPEQTFLLPSQEWLFRAWRRGASLRYVPNVTVMTIPAGYWPVSYGRRECPEHDRLAQWIKGDPRCRERILEDVALAEAMSNRSNRLKPAWMMVRRQLLRPVYSLLIACGVHPQAISAALHQRRRGKAVAMHKTSSGAD